MWSIESRILCRKIWLICFIHKRKSSISNKFSSNSYITIPLFNSNVSNAIFGMFCYHKYLVLLVLRSVTVTFSKNQLGSLPELSCQMCMWWSFPRVVGNFKTNDSLDLQAKSGRWAERSLAGPSLCLPYSLMFTLAVVPALGCDPVTIRTRYPCLSLMK